MLVLMDEFIEVWQPVMTGLRSIAEPYQLSVRAIMPGEVAPGYR